MNCIIKEDCIEVDVIAASWQDALRKAGSLLVQKQWVTPEFLEDMIHTVEKFGPYMLLLPEVAFFHGPPNDHVKQTCLSLITLKEPVFFQEFEGQRMACAFAFGAVDHESHLEMLKEVASLLQNEAFIHAITHHGSKEEILKLLQNHQRKEAVYETEGI